jgi:hypothetical protein
MIDVLQASVGMAVREEFLELLRTDRAFREDVRRQILTEDLLALPERFAQLTEIVGHSVSLLQETLEIVRHLAEAQQRSEEQIRLLLQAQLRTEERVGRLEAGLERLTEAQLRTEEGLQRQGEQIQALTQAQLRTEERVGRLEAGLERLTEAQLRTEERVGRLEAGLESVESALQRLTEAQLRTEEELRWLTGWQRGESGRRDGERYERETVRRALALFNGGQGGAPDQPWVQQRLTEQLGSRVAWGLLEPEDDPFLADLLWWKGEQLAVVEISIQVNGQDVVRAARWAETLRQVGTQAFAVVIGDDWATPESHDRARAQQVEWKVGSNLSEGFLAFRRTPSA